MNSIFFKTLLIFSFFLLNLCSDSQGTLSVHGSATLSLKPDQVIITLDVKTLSQTAKESLYESNQIIAKAVVALTQINLSEEEIGTSNFNLLPIYEYIYHEKNHSQSDVFKGYQTSYTLIVKTNKLDMAGIIIDAAVNSGVKNIRSVDFEISPTILKDTQDGMIELAVKDAKNKAELALKPLGGKIIGIKSVNFDHHPTPNYRDYSISNAKSYDVAESTTEIHAQSKDVKVGVNIEFYFE